MKKSLETTLKSQASAEDLKVIQLMIQKMNLIDSYYGEYVGIFTDLRYKQFSTLNDEFKNFYKETIFNAGTYSINDLNSLKQSLILLRDSTIVNVELSNVWYKNFLDTSIRTMDQWLVEILEQIKASS